MYVIQERLTLFLANGQSFRIDSATPNRIASSLNRLHFFFRSTHVIALALILSGPSHLRDPKRGNFFFFLFFVKSQSFELE